MGKHWEVRFSNKAGKQTHKLQANIQLVLRVLVENLVFRGPVPGKQWHNYGRLRGRGNEDKRHCHLIKGNPTYVCCWQVFKTKQLIEVYYVGTHEKAPY